jgi:hypothetical protein
MKLLKEYRRKEKFIPIVKNSKFDLKENKKIKKAISKVIREREEEMKSNIITTIITVLTVAVSSYVFVFQTGTQYQEIKNGINQNSKQLTELINLNKDTVKNVAVLQRKTDKMEIYQNLNKERIKNLESKK